MDPESQLTQVAPLASKRSHSGINHVAGGGGPYSRQIPLFKSSKPRSLSLVWFFYYFPVSNCIENSIFSSSLTLAASVLNPFKLMFWTSPEFLFSNFFAVIRETNGLIRFL